MPMITSEQLELSRKLNVLAESSSKAAREVLAKPGAVDNEILKKMIVNVEATIVNIKALQSDLDIVR